MSWYEKVLDVMKRKNITQKDLAKKSGIAESSLSRYLRSENRPRMDVVINIAKALEIETQYLLDEEETSESAFNSIATAVARKGNELTAEEKNRLIALYQKTHVHPHFNLKPKKIPEKLHRIRCPFIFCLTFLF